MQFGAPRERLLGLYPFINTRNVPTNDDRVGFGIQVSAVVPQIVHDGQAPCGNLLAAANRCFQVGKSHLSRQCIPRFIPSIPLLCMHPIRRCGSTRTIYEIFCVSR